MPSKKKRKIKPTEDVVVLKLFGKDLLVELAHIQVQLALALVEKEECLDLARGFYYSLTRERDVAPTLQKGKLLFNSLQETGTTPSAYAFPILRQVAELNWIKRHEYVKQVSGAKEEVIERTVFCDNCGNGAVVTTLFSIESIPCNYCHMKLKLC